MATGDQGVVLETFDGGTTWKPRYSRTPHSLFGISAANDTTVFACGDYGTLLRYTVPDADLGTVSGYVYDDANNNGARDPGELELTGWKIVLNGPRPDSVFSGPDGSFLFTRLPFGSYTLAEVSQGSWAQTQPVTPTYSFGLIDTASNFTGDFGNYSASTWGYMMKGQWNLVSLPLTVADARKSTLYPTSASPAYAYSDHYYVMDTIRNGTGYWLKYPSSQITWIDGTGITSDTIPLVSGWNLIGSVIDSVMVASLQTDPPGILTPSIFTYNGSYVDATSISPGAGYWLKTTSAGTLYLHQGAFASSFPRSADAHAALKDLNLLTIKDAAGSSHTLYFGSQTSGSQSPGNIQPGDFALPPLPPEQCFDARFSSGSEVALFASQSAQGIAVQTASYPVTLNWEMRQARNGAVFALEDVKTGRIVSLISGSEGKTILPSPAPGGLKLVYLPEGAGSLIPKDYALEQNAPNPFNPTTRISFALPEDAQVRLDIYTITGQIVSRLVDGPLHAGYHDYEWNPGASAGGASGIYFYRLQAVSAQDQSKIFTSTRKMLFLK
jgi:hypothetical protein